MAGKKGFRTKVFDKMNKKMAESVTDTMLSRINVLIEYLEDLAESQDQLTKAVISLYNNQKAMAEKIDVKLPEPLVEMDIEEGDLKMQQETRKKKRQEISAKFIEMKKAGVETVDDTNTDVVDDVGADADADVTDADDKKGAD